MIKYHPWKIYFPIIRENINKYFLRIERTYGNELRSEIYERFFMVDQMQMKFDSGYPFLFIKNLTFNVKTQGVNNNLNVLFAIGKRKNGFYHLISPSYIPVNNSYELFDYLKTNEVKYISNIIKDSSISIDKRFLYIYQSHLILSYTSFVNELMMKVQDLKQRAFNEKEIILLEAIFNQTTESDAFNLIKTICDEVDTPQKKNCTQH